MGTQLFKAIEATDLSGAQEALAFAESLTEAYKPRSIGEFVGLQKHKAILSKLAANPRPFARFCSTGRREQAKLQWPTPLRLPLTVK